jgi:4a-hydroxytetrahydrobiopterin dehydratase
MKDREGAMRTYAQAQIEERLGATLPGWRYAEGQLRRTYRTHGWKGTLLAAGAVAHLAEAAWHHPDLLLSYDSIEVRLASHDAQGITERDFALAAKIEELLLWQPGKEDGPFEGTPQGARHAYIEYG